MGSTSHHIMPLVIDSLGVDTHTHTHIYTSTHAHRYYWSKAILRNQVHGSRRLAHTWLKRSGYVRLVTPCPGHFTDYPASILSLYWPKINVHLKKPSKMVEIQQAAS